LSRRLLRNHRLRVGCSYRGCSYRGCVRRGRFSRDCGRGCSRSRSRTTSATTSAAATSARRSWSRFTRRSRRRNCRDRFRWRRRLRLRSRRAARFDNWNCHRNGGRDVRLIIVEPRLQRLRRVGRFFRGTFAGLLAALQALAHPFAHIAACSTPAHDGAIRAPWRPGYPVTAGNDSMPQ